MLKNGFSRFNLLDTGDSQKSVLRYLDEVTATCILTQVEQNKKDDITACFILKINIIIISYNADFLY